MKPALDVTGWPSKEWDHIRPWRHISEIDPWASPHDEREVLRVCLAAPWEKVGQDWAFLRELRDQTEPFSAEQKIRLAAAYRRVDGGVFRVLDSALKSCPGTTGTVPAMEHVFEPNRGVTGYEG
jgi:hypothetical protein